MNAGGRTGLAAVIVAVLFLATLFFAPLAGSVPLFATAPALVLVGCLMMQGARDIDYEDATEYVPAAVTILAMPLTYSIADGIAFGLVAYAGIKLLAGRTERDFERRGGPGRPVRAEVCAFVTARGIRGRFWRVS